MRIRFPLIACGLALSLPVLAGVGEWTSNGPFGGEVTRVAINPEDSQHMIAFSLLGVSRTIDGGASWTSINDSRLISVDVEFDPDNDQIYVTNTAGQVLRSGDLGETWSGGFTLPEPVSGFRALSIANVPGSTDVYLAVAPFEAEAALTTVLLFRSTDLGATFTPIASGAGIPDAAAVRDVLALDTGGTTLLAGMGSRDLGASLPQPPNIYRSTDSGATWTPVLTLAGMTSFTPDTQLVRAPVAACWRSWAACCIAVTMPVLTWTAITATAGGSISFPNTIAADPLNPARFYTRGGAVALTLGGSAVSAGLSACDITGTQFLCTAIARLSPNLSYTMAQGTESLPGDVNSIQVDPAGAVWVGTDGLGVSRVSFVAGGWITEQFNLGLSAVNVRAILIHPNPSTIGGGQHRRLYVGYGDIVTETAGVYLTTNGGTNWSPSNTGVRLTGVRDRTIDPRQPASASLQERCRFPRRRFSHRGAGPTGPFRGLASLGRIKAVRCCEARMVAQLGKRSVAACRSIQSPSSARHTACRISARRDRWCWIRDPVLRRRPVHRA
ncbi:MAG: hypothetical protein IPK97_06450 [Ahniella sp.]|nr:hypothetical protein [Ahniella sp.]